MYSYWINTKIVMRQRGSFPLLASAIGGAKVLLQTPPSDRCRSCEEKVIFYSFALVFVI
jgi:hypothetical protein